MTKPRTIAIAWEFGGNYGHAVQIAQLLPHLTKAAAVSIIAANPQAVRAFAPHFEGPVIRAPRVPDHLDGSQQSSESFADDLAKLGWGNANALSNMLSQWLDLYSRISPDLVIAKAAPTALLAAKSKGIATYAIGFGYDLPPMTSPLPPFQHWTNTPEKDIARLHREDASVAIINTALETLKLPVIHHLTDALSADHSIILSIEATDPYTPRAQSTIQKPSFAGPITALDQGEIVNWTPDKNGKIFGYLRLTPETHPNLIESLKALGQRHDVILSAPGAPINLAHTLRACNVRIIDGPARLDQILSDCDLGISHGSNNMATCYSMFRIPQICFPRHIEQMMITKTVTDHGQGIGFSEKAKTTSILAAAETLLTSTRHKGTDKGGRSSELMAYIQSIPLHVANKILESL